MEDDQTAAAEATTSTSTSVLALPAAASNAETIAKAKSAIESLSSIISSVPKSLAGSDNPATALLNDPEVANQISALLRQPLSGAGDNPLCRWLYDTFQSTDPGLQLVVLRYLPIIAGAYLSRVGHVKSLAGFEAVLLALYAHETTARSGQSLSVNVPDLTHPSVYHESKEPSKSNATGLSMAVISPSLEPYGTVRSTRRARIVGVALELFYSRISEIPVASKMDFCEFCILWSGLDGEMYKNDDVDGSHPKKDEVDKEASGEQQQLSSDDDEGEEKEKDGRKEEEEEDGDEDEKKKEKDKNKKIKEEEEKKAKEEEEKKKEKAKMDARITLPWELLQPVLRILGHCLLGLQVKDDELRDAASRACRSLYARALHDINPKAVLATQSLLRVIKINMACENDPDPTEIPTLDIIVL